MPNIGDIYKYRDSDGHTLYWLCSDVIKSPKGEYQCLGFNSLPSEEYPVSIGKITIAKKNFYYAKRNCLLFENLPDPELKGNYLYRMDEFYHNIVDQCKLYDQYLKILKDDERISAGGVFKGVNDFPDSFIIIETLEEYYLCYAVGPDNYAQKTACMTKRFHNLVIDEKIKYDRHLKPMEWLSYKQKFTTGIQFFIDDKSDEA